MVTEAVPAFLTIAVMPLTYSIAYGECALLQAVNIKQLTCMCLELVFHPHARPCPHTAEHTLRRFPGRRCVLHRLRRPGLVHRLPHNPRHAVPGPLRGHAQQLGASPAPHANVHVHVHTLHMCLSLRRQCVVQLLVCKAEGSFRCCPEYHRTSWRWTTCTMPALAATAPRRSSRCCWILMLCCM